MQYVSVGGYLIMSVSKLLYSKFVKERIGSSHGLLISWPRFKPGTSQKQV